MRRYMLDLLHESDKMDTTPQDIEEEKKEIRNKMKCKRCGCNEDRIDGFCSIYCKNMSYGEDDTKLLETVRKNIIDHWHIADQFCSHSRLAEIVVMRVSELRDYESQQLVFDCSEFEGDVTDE